MAIVVDASVAFKWFVDEAHTENALRLLLEHECIAPDLLLLEIRNAVLTRVRGGGWSKAQAISVEKEIDRLSINTFPTAPLLSEAFSIGLELGHPIYDCVYLAGATVHDCLFVTADSRFLAAARRSDYSERVIALGDFEAR